MADFNPDKALVIIFGASEWPECPNEMSHDGPESENPFLNSATGMEDYFLNYLRIKEDNLLNLFNSEETPSDIVKKMKEFLKARNSQFPDKKDLFFYYVGHGNPEEKDYCLFLRSTRKDDVESTSFQIGYLRGVIKEARYLRCYVIVDACFSGKIFSSVPETANGIVLFCSSMAEKTSSSKGSEHRTMFTSAVLKVLEKGKGRTFSFDELCSSVGGFITETYKDIDNNAVIPQIHSKQVQENLAKIPIFNFHKPKKPDEKNRMITWHITTSSKGGVGKTLLSLFLLTHYTTNDKVPLVIDFNGVNADIKRIIADKTVIFKDRKGNPVYFWDDDLVVVKIKQGGYSYLLGWLRESYKMYEPKCFFNFLSYLRDKQKEIKKPFNKRIDTIIIDTNYHFGNIFSKEKSDYDTFKFWGRDRFFIWFIWVYRQIQNCYHQYQQQQDMFYQSFNNDVEIMKAIAEEVEEHITINGSPFIHVFNPSTLIDEEPTLKGILQRVVGQPGTRQVESLLNLAKLEPSTFRSDFFTMVEHIVAAQQDAGQESFASMLEKLATNLHTRPKNLFPIHFYQRSLNNYHSKLHYLAKTIENPVYKECYKKLFKILL
jgi:GTPase SAR1 family protein